MKNYERLIFIVSVCALSVIAARTATYLSLEGDDISLVQFWAGFLGSIFAAGFTSTLVVFIQHRWERIERVRRYERFTGYRYVRQVIEEHGRGRLSECEGQEVSFSHSGGETLTIIADYGDQRGVVEAVVQFNDESMLSAEGSFRYIAGPLAPGGEKDCGTYQLILFPSDPNRVRVVWHSTIPDAKLSGYEIWARVHKR